MLVILFAGAVVIAMSVQMFFEQKKRREGLDDYKRKSGSHLKSIDFGKESLVGQILTIVICLGLGVYVYFNPASVKNENVWGYIGISILLAASFVFNMIITKDMEKLYYNKESFYLNGQVIRFSSVKNFNKKAMGGFEIELYSAGNVKVPKAAVKPLQDLLEERKNAKKAK